MKSPELRLGEVRFDPDAGTLTDATGQPVELRHQAMEVLRLLAARPGEVVDRASILERIWEDRAGAEDGLVQCIAEIRRALDDSAKTIVETIPRRGYRLVVTRNAPRPARRVALAGLAALVLVAALAGGWRLWTGPGAKPVAPPVIAVLPFETGDADPDAAGIADAIGDSIIASLAGYSEFDVIARQSSFRFRDSESDVAGFGAALGADYLVQGRQDLADRTLRLSVQLIAVDGATLEMVDALEVPLDEMFAANERIAHRIANIVSGSVMTRNARADRPAGTVDALILDNRGRQLFQSGPTPEKWRAALELHQQAIDSHPDVEWGYVGKALMLRTGVRFGYDDGAAGTVLAEAETAALKAIELNPENYATHFALGRVRMQQGDIAGSIAALKRAGDLNPSSAMVLNALAQSYLYGDDAAALEHVVARVRVIDPLPGTLTLWVRAWAQWQLGDCDAARETVGAMPHAPLDANKLRAVILICTGAVEAARAEIAAYLAERPDWTLRREVDANAVNWVSDGPRARWLAALSEAGVPD